MSCCCPCHETRGRRINRRAWLMAQIVLLRQRVPEAEKLARSTPSKTMHRQWEIVRFAQHMAPVLRAELEAHERELSGLNESGEERE